MLINHLAWSPGDVRYYNPHFAKRTLEPREMLGGLANHLVRDTGIKSSEFQELKHCSPLPHPSDVGQHGIKWKPSLPSPAPTYSA